MKIYSHLIDLAKTLDKEGFVAESLLIDNTIKSTLLKSEATDFTSYVLDPVKYPATTASDEVAALLGQGETLVNNYHGAANYMNFILPNFIERLDWLSRKYKDQITESDKTSLGKLERDLHQIAKKINNQAPG